MPKDKKNNEQKLRETIGMLAERLAISQAYLQAIDDTVDVFADLERGKAMLITNLVNRAQIDGLQKTPGYTSLRVDPREIITAARQNSPLPIRGTSAYKELHDVIINMARETWQNL